MHNILWKTEKWSTMYENAALDSFLCIHFVSGGPKPSSDSWRSEQVVICWKELSHMFWCTIQTHTISNLNFENFHNFRGWKESLQKYVAHPRDKLFLIYANLKVWVLSHSKSLIEFIKTKHRDLWRCQAEAHNVTTKNVFIPLFALCCVNCLFFNSTTCATSLIDCKRILVTQFTYMLLAELLCSKGSCWLIQQNLNIISKF